MIKKKTLLRISALALMMLIGVSLSPDVFHLWLYVNGQPFERVYDRAVSGQLNAALDTLPSSGGIVSFEAGP